MNIILFNGPPSCGKDTAARHLWDLWDTLQLPGFPAFVRMSTPNKAAFAAITVSSIDEFSNNIEFERVKEQPQPLFNGASYRQWQIDFSEKFMKPLYGDDVFGKLFIRRVCSDLGSEQYTYLVPDCGFQVELQTVRDAFPRAKIMLIRIHRDGCDFSKDSRSYLQGIYGVHEIDLDNNGTERAYLTNIEHLVRNFIK